jgi:thiamine biosynthesis lipoprotein
MLSSTPLPQAVPAGFRHAEFGALGSRIVVGVTEPLVLPPALEHVRAAFHRIDCTLSRFREDSELRRLERHPGAPAIASPLFLEVLELACRAAASTDGWFDPTVRDAVEAAGYDRSIELLERDGPGAERDARPAGRWPLIRYDRGSGMLLVPAGVRLDFGGIGKGFAVDYALRDIPTGGGGVLVSAGGDLGVTGMPPGAGWPCEIAATPEGATETVVLLQQGALATSGLGRRQWRRNGNALHHLIDPHTGRPAASPWRIVTVAARTCVAAEVAAKVAWLMGEAGPAWVARQGLTARFSGTDGEERTVGWWPTTEERT